jgi:hypothetical protein
MENERADGGGNPDPLGQRLPRRAGACFGGCCGRKATRGDDGGHGHGQGYMPDHRDNYRYHAHM